MAIQPVGAFVYDTSLTYTQMRNAYTANSTATIIAGQFVKLSSGAFLPNATSDTTTFGFTIAAGATTSTEPYAAPNGLNINAIDVLDTRFAVNAIAAFTPTAGLAYDLVTSSGVPYINSTTAAPFFRVERIHPGDARSDTAPRYVCSVVATRQ